MINSDEKRRKIQMDSGGDICCYNRDSSDDYTPAIHPQREAAWEFLLPVITLVLGYEFGKDS